MIEQFIRRIKNLISTVAVIILSTVLLAGCFTHGTLVVGSDHSEVRSKQRSHVAEVNIPPGHLPPPGKCRIWLADKPPGQQPPPGNCETLRYQVPPGARLIRG